VVADRDGAGRLPDRRSKPVARFEEAVATIRALWDSRGEPISRESRYFPLRDAVFDLPPYRGSRPEIWVAAHGPRMLRAAGRYADAWYPQAALRQDYARGLAAVRTAASDAGRDPMAITPAAGLFVITGRSRDDVDEALNSDIAKAFALNIPTFLHRNRPDLVDEGILPDRPRARRRRSSRTLARPRTALPGRDEPVHPSAQPAK
jgi:phthiodiolone/phenolphthiodiolone dimycocerosates ketoreductase